MIHGHGDDAFRYDAIKMNFSSNLPGFADLTALKAHLSTYKARNPNEIPT